MNVEITGNGNVVVGRDFLQQRCELAERLLARKLDPVRSEPCPVCAWTCAVSALACPCCGADMKVERARRVLQSASRWLPAMTVVALLLAGAATFFVGLGLLRAQAGLPVGSPLSAAAAPVIAVASLAWVGAMWLLQWRDVQ